jgi:hypothetical protein
VVVAPAVGLRGKNIQLFEDAAPAPERVERSFASLDQGVPPSLGTGVEADRARKVLETQGVVLWLAPTTRGGFCSLVEVRGNEGGGECVTRYDRLNVDVSLHGRIALIHGFAQQQRAASLVLGFQDGESASVPLVWVSAPVDTGFFVYAVPEQHRREGTCRRHSGCWQPTGTSSTVARSTASLRSRAERGDELLLQPREIAVDRQRRRARILRP